MATKYDIDNNKRYAPTGYEGNNEPDYVIPSCGLEDLDKSVFDLFDKQIPLYHELQGSIEKVPVIFATGERFAILRRKKPLIDKNGALILPLISITRGAVDAVPQKGIANNQMFPHVVTKRISRKDLEYRQQKNIEGLRNVKGEDLNQEDGDFSLKPKIENNIVETIEMPPLKYFSANYEITIWSSFTQQMNKFLESILNAYTLNPGQQFRLESDKGYTFSAFMESSFSQDTNYADFTDAERYIKYNMSLNATGYLIAPNILGGKTSLRSFLSAPQISFDVLDEYENIDPQLSGAPVDSNPDAHMFDDLSTEDSFVPAQGVGVRGGPNAEALRDVDASAGFAAGLNLEKYTSESVGARGSDWKKTRKTFVRNSEGKLVPVMAKASKGKGETVYDARLAEVLFNISNNKE